jgi:uroporphyrinogen III methyltransferase/synthase
VTGPLAHVRVVVTRPAQQTGSFARSLELLGARVIPLPLIAIVDPASWDELDEGLLRLRRGAYDWVALMSVNAVERFFRRLGGPRPNTRFAAVGRATAAALEAKGAAPDLVSRSGTAESLVAALGRGPGRVLLPRVEGAPPVAWMFAEAGWALDEVTAYRNVRAPRPPSQDEVEEGRFDAITFLSPSAVHAFVDAVAWRGLGLRAGEWPRRPVACIGPSTAAAARREEMRVDVVPEEHTGPALAGALALEWVRAAPMGRSVSPRRARR